MKEKTKYNGLTFSTNGQIWTAKINGRKAAFSFLPAEVQNINSTGDFSKILTGKYEIDTTSEVNSTNKEYIALAEHQMGLTLGSYNIYLSKGFTANNSFGFRFSFFTISGSCSRIINLRNFACV